MNPWTLLLDVIKAGLTFLHSGFAPLAGVHAWGWAIVGLTVIIRVLLLPLAVKQTRSMRAMQALQPEIQRIREKYKTDRTMMRSKPDKYRRRKEKQNEEMMALYKEYGVNPAASCLPLVLQAPIFFALFRVLQNDSLRLAGERLARQPFYMFERLGQGTSGTGVWGWVLIVLMAATMFFTQRQMQGRAQATGQQATQQKLLGYGMPVFMAGVTYTLPVGVVLYIVTTTLWQVAQQAVILRGLGGGGSEQEEDREPTQPREVRARSRSEKAPEQEATGPGGRDGKGRGYEHLPRRAGGSTSR